jgi:hypothetical protein
MSVTWATLDPSRRQHWPISDDYTLRSPTDSRLRPSRGVGAQSGRPGSAVAAVRSRALCRTSCCARALHRVSRSQYLASRLLFSGVCRASDPIRDRLSHGGERVREGALGPDNYGVCWEHARACGGLCRSRLCVRSVVTTARHHSRIEAWAVEMSGRVAGCAHPLEKSGSGFADASIDRLPFSREVGKLRRPLL